MNDRNDRPSRALRELVFARSAGVCQRDGCARPITMETFHVAHVVARSHGGTLDPSNLEAWCIPCNLSNGARDAGDPRLPPRDWQIRALETIVKRISADGAATLSAAPGAGKTVFAGQVYNELYHADVIDRLVVLVPRVALVSQWVDALARSCQIQLKPGSAIEREGQRGVVVTYQSLISREMVDVHRMRAKHARTLVVLDEVHHVGEQLSETVSGWAANVISFVGDLDQLHVAGVLNLSGTLWRSDKRERISTVRYHLLENGRLESDIDFAVSVGELIDAGELRPLDFYRMGAQVKLADYANLEYVEGNLADIDETAAKAAIKSLPDIVGWRTGFVTAVLDRLEIAHRSLDGYHAKALIVAFRIDQARAFEAEVNRQMAERGLRPLAMTAASDLPEAGKVLERFREQRRVGVLCTVDMAGEGYDCPDIAVIGYATIKLTAMYVRQVVARAMRVTDHERQLAKPIPAAIVAPDAAPLVEQLLSYLKPYSHEIFDPGLKGPPGPGPLPPRWLLDEAATARKQVSVPLPDGSLEHVDGELAKRYEPYLEAVGVPPVYAPRTMIANRRTGNDWREEHPFDQATDDVEDFARTETIEDRAAFLAKSIDRCGAWWHHNGDPGITVAEFQYAINEAGGIPKGGRKTASLHQLELAYDFAAQMVRRYCNETGQQVPAYARPRKHR